MGVHSSNLGLTSKFVEHLIATNEMSLFEDSIILGESPSDSAECRWASLVPLPLNPPFCDSVDACVSKAIPVALWAD